MVVELHIFFVLTLDLDNQTASRYLNFVHVY
jgi:hypothetical protein